MKVEIMYDKDNTSKYLSVLHNTTNLNLIHLMGLREEYNYLKDKNTFTLKLYDKDNNLVYKNETPSMIQCIYSLGFDLTKNIFLEFEDGNPSDKINFTIEPTNITNNPIEYFMRYSPEKTIYSKPGNRKESHSWCFKDDDGTEKLVSYENMLPYMFK